MSCTGRLGLVRSTRNYQLIILFKGIIGKKQLTVFEMESIAGGTFDLADAAQAITQAVGGAIVGAIGLGLAGTILGGRYAGSNGGLLGFGLLGNAVGFLWGLFAGGVGGAVVGAMVGYDTAISYFKDGVEGLIDGTFNLWA